MVVSMLLPLNLQVGCAGWWYVRLASYPYPEGWAPSTYLEKVAKSSSN